MHHSLFHWLVCRTRIRLAVRPLPHESDSEQDNSNKHRNTSAWSQHVQGPLELRFPVFAHFIDKIRRPTWSADPFARQQITDACKEMAQNQSNSRRSIASSLRALLSEFVDGPMHKVPMTSITSGIEQNLGGNNNWGTTRMYRDDDMIVYLELKETMGSLTADPSLNDPYFQTKVKDKDDCFPCPHASFTVVLADIYVGVYGTVTNHTAVSSQQWLVPLLPITSIHQHLRYNQRLVNVLAALRDSIHELRQAISSASSSLSISDLPAIGSLTGLENLSLEHPMGKDTFLYRGKYGTNDVVVKICQSYCVEAHECLESTRLAPKIFWHGEIAGWKVIVMKYYAGRPRKKLKDKQVAMCEQVLAQLHNHGFVHGDARTSNFVWSPSQLPLLIDFDCSGPIGKTFHPPTAISGDEMDAIAIAGGKDYPVGSLVEPDHDFDMLSTRR